MQRLLFAIASLVITSSVGAQTSSEEDTLQFTYSGYWQARTIHIGNLFLGQPDYNDIGKLASDEVDNRLGGLRDTSFYRHQMRLSPRLSYGEIATLQADLDILDGVIWGDNAEVAALPLFATDPSSTGFDGNPIDGLSLRRLWLELKIPVGVLRVGRQPSQWGLGLLANKGDGLGADFGDFQHGLSADRILFATKPVQIVQTLMGNPNAGKGWGSKLIMAFAYDQIVDLADKADAENGEATCSTCPPQVVLSRPGDDVHQYVLVLAYKDEKANLLTDSDVLVAGVYGVHRVQKETKSKVWILDAHLKLRLGNFGLETEVLFLAGDTEAIDTGFNPKTIDIKGGALRAGYYEREFDIELELGWAPGDSETTDENFTGFPFHPDYNVGLLLYEQVLAARTARAWTRDQRGLWSKGGVWNSKYIYPKIRWRPSFVEGLSVTGAFLWAQANADTNAIWFATTEAGGGDLDLGYEIDLAVRYDFYRYFHGKVEAGVFIPGRALWKDVAPKEAHDLLITDADRADVAWTVQGRLGMEF